jgi:phage terminase small subunit
VLGKPWVQKRIAEAQAARRARTEVDSDFVLRRLIDEVNADAADLYDANNRLKPVKEWPEVWRRGLVSTIRTTTLYGRGKDRGEEIGEQIDIVLVDRARRLELLGRHIKVNAFAADKLQIGLDTPLAELFKQISGNVIRPKQESEPKLIEHEPDTTQDMRGKARKRPPGRDEDTQE